MPDPSNRRDDSLMERFDEEQLRRFSARDAVLSTVLIALLLLVFSGGSVRQAGEEMDPGTYRDVVLAIGEPAGWVADRLPFSEVGHSLTGWLSPDAELVGATFEEGTAGAAGGPGGGPSPVTPEWFEAGALGEPEASGRSAPCWSPATRSRPRSTSSSASGWRRSASTSSATRTWRPGSPATTWSTGASSRRPRSPTTVPTRW